MSWLLAFAGFAVLIVLHELGHFLAAKAVGMRVERFALFFPPLLFKVRRGETEYGIGAIPLGGYVRISGMNPTESLPAEVVPRAYYKQPVWKRIVVISAGPAMNFLIAFLILWALFMVNGKPVSGPDGMPRQSQTVRQVETTGPASATLLAGDRIVSIDGVRSSPEAIRRQIATHVCAVRPPRDGCRAQAPARVVVERAGRTIPLTITPRYDAAVRRPRLGFSFDTVRESVGPAQAAGLAVSGMWRVSTLTVETIARIFDPEKRKEISSVVGGYETTRKAVEFDATTALTVLALISLSLGLINLFPFLPLDGGHIFWALAEKVRGRPIPFRVMERAGIVGFVLVLFLFFIGLSNDIGRLSGDGFQVR